MLNPMELMHIKPNIDAFCERHQNFVRFLGYAGKNLTQDCLIEVTLTDPDGNPVRTNLRVSPEDLELLHQLGSLLGKA